MSLLPKTLLETESPLSGKIKVVQVGRERRLVVGGLVQSINFDAPDVKERIWGKIATEVQSSKFKVQNCLILGLGGGTIAHLLTHKFGQIPIDAVEIDSAIVEIGRKFFDLDKLPDLNIIIGDAVDVVKSPPDYSLLPSAYRLIVVDIYCGGEYPAAAESGKFFAGLKRFLDPKGLIIFNRVATAKEAGFEEKLKKHFGVFKKTAVPSKFGGENIVYTCSPNPSK